MRMLFASSDVAEIEVLGKKLAEAGIPCSVRYEPAKEGMFASPAHGELCIQQDEDACRAATLFLQLSSAPATATQSSEPVRRGCAWRQAPMVGRVRFALL